MSHELRANIPNTPENFMGLITRICDPVSRADAPESFSSQRALIQALIKIYVRLVIAQSIQLSNIVLVNLRPLTRSRQVWVLLTSESYNIKTTRTISEVPPTQCSTSTALTPNIALAFFRINFLPLLRSWSIRIDAALNLRQPLLVLVNHRNHRDHAANDKGHDRHHQAA
jgi:hypothetical protein